MSKRHNKIISEQTLQKINRISQKYNRSVEDTEQREYFLIVCEGTKTEPNYFGAIKRNLPNELVLIIDGAGANTMSLVNRARQLNVNRTTNMGSPYDYVWIVFDKDSFSAEDFNNAVFMCKAHNFNVAYSNEAFELWYLLHFEYLNSGISRSDYVKKLEEIIKEKTGNKKFRYKKNSPEFYNILCEHGSEEQAIRYAKKLEKMWDQKNPAKECPSTYVYKLVEKLRKY